MHLPDWLNLDAKLNPFAVGERTQHAIAGEAAVGLARLTSIQADMMKPGYFVSSYIKKMNHFAQKAEVTRRVLERYLTGTEVDRIEPVFVPAHPMSYSAYSFPAQDPSVWKAEHMPYNLESWKYDMNKWSATPRIATANMEGLIFLSHKTTRQNLIKNFI